MTDPSTPVPSDEAVLAAEKLERAWSTHGGYYPGARAYLAAAYAIDAPRIAAEAAAEARAATLREVEALRAELARLKSIIDRPDPHDFIAASEIEARYQLDLWGTGEGFPTAFNGTNDAAFIYLIAYLAGKVAATPDDNEEKKLHRVTTIAAAAANWHAAILKRVVCPHCEYGNVWITNDGSVPCDRCDGTGKTLAAHFNPEANDGE